MRDYSICSTVGRFAHHVISLFLFICIVLGLKSIEI